MHKDIKEILYTEEEIKATDWEIKSWDNLNV